MLFVAAGCDPFELVERGVAAAARLSGGAGRSADKEAPPSLDLFGWCTCVQKATSAVAAAALRRAC